MKNRTQSDWQGLYPPADEAFAQRMEQLIAHLPTQKEEKLVKRKLSFGLILAILLALLLATCAVALTNWDQLQAYFETVRTMETEGELARWSEADKLKLAQAMLEAELIPAEDERAQRLQDAACSTAERAKAAESLIAERYGADYFDSHTVEEAEFPTAERSQEEQTAYAQWDEDYWSEWQAKGRQPLTESRTYLATLNNLTEIGEFPRELLREVRVESSWDGAAQAYAVTASINKEVYLQAKQENDQGSLFDVDVGGFVNGDDLCFRFWLDQYGTYLGIDDQSDPAKRAALTLEEGQALAEKALKVRLNVEQETLDGMTLRATYSDSGQYDLAEGRFKAACTYIWKDETDQPRYFVDIDAQTGRVYQAFDWVESDAMEEKAAAWLRELKALVQAAGVSDTLMNEDQQYFWHWTVEEKAAWSQTARPIIQAYVAEHEAFAQYLTDLLAGRYRQDEWPNLVAVAQYAYGMPDETCITQARAYAIAREAAIAAGAKPSYVDDNEGHTFYFDVTDPDRPLWKVEITLTFGAADTAHPYDPTDPWGFFVEIDAHTGEVVGITQRTVNTQMRELV